MLGFEPGPKDRKSSALSIAPIGSWFRKPNFACQTFKRFEVSEKFANKEIQECATCKHQKCETSVRNQRISCKFHVNFRSKSSEIRQKFTEIYLRVLWQCDSVTVHCSVWHVCGNAVYIHSPCCRRLWLRLKAPNRGGMEENQRDVQLCCRSSQQRSSGPSAPSRPAPSRGSLHWQQPSHGVHCERQGNGIVRGRPCARCNLAVQPQQHAAQPLH